MFKNYFRVALRNIRRYKFFAFINILGMTIGITACLLILIYIIDEVSYDTFHQDADRIYQVGLHGKIGGQDLQVANTCPALAQAAVNEIPEVAEAVRVTKFNRPGIKYGAKSFVEEKVFYVDSNFFDFFSFQLLVGDPKEALKNPYSVVLTPAIARKYFGDEDFMGKLIEIGDDKQSFKVTGISAEAPSNSHFHYHALISSNTSEALKNPLWTNNFMFTYLKLHPGTRATSLVPKFDHLVEKYVGPEVERFLGMSLKQMKEQGGAYGYYTTPIQDIHLKSISEGDIEPGGNLTYIYFFGAVGIFIMLIACINFMNLTTAQAAGRAKEVGLRKTLGSMRTQMIVQFLSESTLYAAIAIVLALIACYACMPWFNMLSGKTLNTAFFTQPWFIFSALALIVIVGLFAGSYPAFYLTSFKPAEVLKGKVRGGMKSKGVRSFLVICQFALSIFLVIFTLVVYQQINYMRSQHLGMDKNNVLTVNNTQRLGKNKNAFRNELAKLSFVEKTSFSNNSFPGVNNVTVFRREGVEQDHLMGIYYADPDHQQALKLEMKEGRFFSLDFPSDSSAIIINEAAVGEFGFEKPLGQVILFNDDKPKRLHVIGVVKNFNYESFKDQVRPLAIAYGRDNSVLLVRYTGDPSQVVSSVETLWKKYAADEPLEYAFLDENFDRLFRVEQRMAQIFTIFSCLAIFVASLGLFALSAFTAEQRTKEIGIRKAMGASVSNLTLLLSGEFTRLVIIAFIPAALLGWYAAHRWLEGYVYKIDVSPWIFIASGAFSIVIAWITVGFQSLRAATSNPVHSLRYE